MYTFQEIVAKLSAFWAKQGCIIATPYDIEKGAGTSNPATFFRCLGPEPFRAAYIEPCRRPKDGRFALNPLRLQHYFQFQVILKPSPLNIQDLYLESLQAIGFDLSKFDIRFVHDDWEQPTLGAWGLGWEVWVDGMECSQFTYFQSMAELPLKPVTGELTYGLERLIMQLQKVDSFTQIQWNDTLTYGDIYTENEVQWSEYNFDASDAETLLKDFEDYKNEAKRLVSLDLPIPAYDFVLKSSHTFNLLDARGAISVAQRQSYITHIRELARAVATSFLANREKKGFPLLSKWSEFEPVIHTPTLSQEHVPQSAAKTDFLLEIGSEEIPATFVAIGLASLEREIKALLTKVGLSHGAIATYGTPRRLAVVVKDLATRTESKIVEKKGPSLSSSFDSEGMPTQIGLGFLKSIGCESITLLQLQQGQVPLVEIRLIKDIPYLFGKQTTEAIDAFSLLQKNLSQIVLGIDFPKKMRWANFDISFARPIRWIVALLDSQVIPFTVGPITSGRSSCGHRQLNPKPFDIKRASDYVDILMQHDVMVDPMMRLKEIQDQLHAIEKDTHLKALVKERVSHEVVHLVEKPFLTVATFDERFLKVPKEVLISEMVEHQRYYPLASHSNELSNKFIITCNVPPSDSIRHGNQRVLSSRLSDGVFLFEQDMQKPLDSFNEKLKKIIFQNGLGSIWDKVERLKKHVGILHSYFPDVDLTQALDAVHLCKADLATEMVGEFPELQGQMGRIYASLQAKPQEVSVAIDEHWMPRGEKAPLPQTETGAIISLADKIDNLLGFFGLDLKPTSSSDPYALRRQAIGLVRIILDQQCSVPLMDVLKRAQNVFDAPINQKNQIAQEILEYCQARAKGVLHEMGYQKDEIESCFAVRSDDFYDVMMRLDALKAVRQNAHFSKLVEVHKRCQGQISGYKALAFSSQLLIENQEKALHNMLETRKSSYTNALQMRNYSDAFSVLAEFQPTLADLFEKVKILDDKEEIRHNRLALLQQVAELFSQIADFQKLQYT